ncbi:hypothetical protein T484DRAFT_1787504 [Baffinella frigidus]|nr:hypothetical protein T484DRAFT_1787504 [Cryptophyta sp. CCMP2293]
MLAKCVDVCLAACLAANLCSIIGAPGPVARPAELRNATLPLILHQADTALHLLGGDAGLKDDAWEREATALLNLENDEPSGYLGKLTAQETGVLEDFRQAHTEKGLSDRALLRYLRARRFHAGTATKLMKAESKWWNEARPDKLRLQDFSDLCQKGFGFIHGADKLNRPAIWFYFSNHDASKGLAPTPIP